VLPMDISQARRKRNAEASHDWRRFAMRERFASMAYMIRYMVQVSGQLHDIAEAWRIAAVIGAGCFNSHNDVEVICLSRRGLEAAVAHCAKDVSCLSQQSLLGSEGAGAGNGSWPPGIPQASQVPSRRRHTCRRCCGAAGRRAIRNNQDDTDSERGSWRVER
jgi:hypothetical protein